MTETPSGRRRRELLPLDRHVLETLAAERAEHLKNGRELHRRIEDDVLRLRRKGIPVRAIADALGVGVATVHGWSERALGR